jgi:hypothetical protein
MNQSIEDASRNSIIEDAKAAGLLSTPSGNDLHENPRANEIYEGKLARIVKFAQLREARQSSQSEPVVLEAIAEVVFDADGKRLNWLIEGGIDAMEVGDELLATNVKLINEDGIAEVYLAAPQQAIPSGYTLIPNTPDKATFISEFEMEVKHYCSACSFHGAQDDCEVCAGEIEYTQKHTIPWTLFKQMYAAIISASPTTPIESDK